MEKAVSPLKAGRDDRSKGGLGGLRNTEEEPLGVLRALRGMLMAV